MRATQITTPDRFLTLQEVATVLGLNQNTYYKNKSLFPVPVPHGKRLKFRESDVMAIISGTYQRPQQQ